MSGSARRAASLLVAGEIALAGILLVGAGLTLRSFANLIAVDPGFRTSHVLTVQMTVPAARYPTPQAQVDFYARVFSALEALPEVEAAGAAAVTPLTGNNWTVGFDRVDRPVPPANVHQKSAGRRRPGATSRRSAFHSAPVACSRIATGSHRSRR